MSYRVEASFPGTENALWWRDQLIGDHPDLSVSRFGVLVVVGGVPDRREAEDLATEAYSRYTADDVDVSHEVESHRHLYREW